MKRMWENIFDKPTIFCNHKKITFLILKLYTLKGVWAYFFENLFHTNSTAVSISSQNKFSLFNKSQHPTLDAEEDIS